jgi:hypothetical protein
MRTALLFVLLMISAASATADDLFVLGGAMRSHNADKNGTSYSWQLEYRKELDEYFEASLSYLNEGHVPAHHRDGHAMQLWGKGSVLDDRVSLSIGIGPYYYFDTTNPVEDGSYMNDHGLGAVFSLAAIWQTETPWLFQLRTNFVKTFGNMDSMSVLAGIGYQLDTPGASRPREPSADFSDVVIDNEITIFAGRTITNSFKSEHSTSFSIEYRRRLWRYLDWTVAWLYEGDTRLVRRDGLVSQFWAVRDFLDDRVSLGFGAGAYFSIDRQAGHNQYDDRIISAIVTLTGSYRLAPHWSLRTSWNRIVTNYDRDTDVILGGISYRF